MRDTPQKEKKKHKYPKVRKAVLRKCRAVGCHHSVRVLQAGTSANCWRCKRACATAICKVCKLTKKGLSGGRCGACRVAGLFLGRCALCGAPEVPCKTVRGRAVCALCRPAFRLAGGDVSLRVKATLKEHAALVQMHIDHAMQIHLYLIARSRKGMGVECLVVLVRFVLYRRFRVLVGLLTPPRSASALAYARSLRKAPPNKTVVLVGVTEPKRLAICQSLRNGRYAGVAELIRCSRGSVSQKCLMRGFDLQRFVARPGGFDRTPLVCRAARLLQDSGMTDVWKRPHGATKNADLARLLYPPSLA